jgi:hypothetical protein
MERWVLMASIELNQPANALWIPAGGLAPPGQIGGGQTRSFESVSNAIRFIMEELSPDDRSTAWITTDHGSLTLQEIQALYNAGREPA